MLMQWLAELRSRYFKLLTQRELCLLSITACLVVASFIATAVYVSLQQLYNEANPRLEMRYRRYTDGMAPDLNLTIISDPTPTNRRSCPVNASIWFSFSVAREVPGHSNAAVFYTTVDASPAAWNFEAFQGSQNDGYRWLTLDLPYRRHFDYTGIDEGLDSEGALSIELKPEFLVGAQCYLVQDFTLPAIPCPSEASGVQIHAHFADCDGDLQNVFVTTMDIDKLRAEMVRHGFLRHMGPSHAGFKLMDIFPGGIFLPASSTSELTPIVFSTMSPKEVRPVKATPYFYTTFSTPQKIEAPGVHDRGVIWSFTMPSRLFVLQYVVVSSRWQAFAQWLTLAHVAIAVFAFLFPTKATTPMHFAFGRWSRQVAKVSRLRSCSFDPSSLEDPLSLGDVPGLVKAQTVTPVSAD